MTRTIRTLREDGRGDPGRTLLRLALLTALAVVALAAPAAAQEVLVEHITDYSSSASTNLPGCTTAATNLVDEFDDAGGWNRLWYADGNAWEGDFKSHLLSGGNDDDYSDDRDFAYFCGHGNVGLVEFTTSNPGTLLTSSEGRWGDEDAEYVTFDTSLTINTSIDGSWYSNGFEGLHLLVGWHDSPLDTNTGGGYADELIDTGWFDGGGETVTTSWFDGSGGCTGQNGGTTQNILAEITAHYDDHIWGEGSAAADQPNNGLGWTWTHDC